MKTKSFRGTLSVAKYTLAQHYKTLSVKIILLVLIVLGFAAIPLLRAIFETGEEVFSLPEIRQIYFRNDTDLDLDPAVFQDIFETPKPEVTISSNSDTALGKVLASEPTSIAYTLTKEKEALCVRVLYAKGGEVNAASADTFVQMGSDAVYHALLNAANVTESQQDVMLASVYGDVKEISELNADSDAADMEAHSQINLMYCYLTIFVTMLSMSYIIALTLEEKTSKLVDTILVSISPTALLTGKIIAVIIFILGGLAALIGSFCVSLLIAKSQGNLDFLTTAMEELGILNIISGIGVKEILILVVSILLSYGMISFLAAIFGSCCSKMEDVQHATLGVMGVIMFGYFVGLIVPLVENKAVLIAASLFPPTAMFQTPANYICGKISLPVLLLSFAIQLICVFLLALLAGKVYHTMILYRGDFPKMKDLFKMLQENRSGQKEGSTDET